MPVNQVLSFPPDANKLLTTGEDTSTAGKERPDFVTVAQNEPDTVGSGGGHELPPSSLIRARRRSIRSRMAVPVANHSHLALFLCPSHHKLICVRLVEALDAGRGCDIFGTLEGIAGHLNVQPPALSHEKATGLHRKPSSAFFV